MRPSGDCASRDFELVIDAATAESIKCTIGSAWVEEDDKVEVRGRDVSTGIVRSIVLTRTEVADAIAPAGRTDSCRGHVLHLVVAARSRQ